RNELTCSFPPGANPRSSQSVHLSSDLRRRPLRDSLYTADYLTGSPVNRIPALCTLYRILIPISSAVSDSTIRAFSSFPPFSARAPGIFPANSKVICFALSSSLHTRMSQSTSSSFNSSSAPRFWNAAATLTPAGNSSLVCSAAEPCHTPSILVVAPPTVAASGTVVSITTVPGFQTLFNCFKSAAQPENGTVSTTTSHCEAVAILSAPAIFADAPICPRSCAAVSSARCASREPITISSPARAQRCASPDPSGPVPPKIPIFLLIAIFLSPADFPRVLFEASGGWRRCCFRPFPLVR